jgi:hypothetical protein
MKKITNILTQFCTVILLGTTAFSQVENVPSNHPIYSFLKRAEVIGLITNYHDAVLPLSRKQVSQFLLQIHSQERMLSETQINLLDDYLVEFDFDIRNEFDNSFVLLGGRNNIDPGLGTVTFNDKEKYLYTYIDSNLCLFTDGLLTLDYRRSRGDGLNEMAFFIDAGFRVRGTLYQKLGYFLKLTNAQFWGSREVLQRDKFISQSYALSTLNSKNFDFSEGYLRYDGGIISVELGRERVLWGNSYGTKLIFSDYPRVSDAIRFDAEYKNIKYTFIHSWILGKPDSILYDSNYNYEPVVADKYFAAHRLELSFGKYVDLGAQEITIYSNRSVDLGYLNPLTFFESVQRSRQERDNGNLAFDIQIRPISGLELQGTLFYDDIHIPLFGKNRWENRMAYQMGIMLVDPLGIPNTNFMFEYTHVEPYTYSHNRSRENTYSSNNVLLGTQIGPNAESWFFRLDNDVDHRLNLSARFELIWSGENIYGLNGRLVKNVGGDFLVSFREGDDPYKDFLGGNKQRTLIGQLFITYEIMNEIFLDMRYESKWCKNQTLNQKLFDEQNYGIAMRIDF